MNDKIKNKCYVGIRGVYITVGSVPQTIFYL